ncbi:MAG: DNA-binding protein [Nitratireductor sp.]|nr:DNA-binding protein [Nitratireductor sp.]
MSKEPRISRFLDDEERELAEAIESSGYEVGESFLTPERKTEIRDAARATINAERVKISLRIQKNDLLRLKAMAMREGMPYQTLISSILHKAVS